jgi:hypothetical protein
VWGNLKHNECAPEEVVTETRENREEEEAKIKAALDRLNALA